MITAMPGTIAPRSHPADASTSAGTSGPNTPTRTGPPTPAPEVVPGLSGDAYSQISHSLAAYVEYSLSERAFLSLGLSGRHGDVVSTSAPNAMIYYASRALAEDPAFGPEAYAYKLPGTTWGARLGVSYSTTAHSLLGAAFERFDTHADGGNDYTKTIVEITWDYRF